MSRNHSVSIAVFIVATLAGCAATPQEGPTFAEARAPQPSANAAVVYAYRAHALPASWAVTIQIDGKEVASLPEGAFTWSSVVPGKHQISAVWPEMSFASGAAMELDAKPGTIHYVEFSSSVAPGTFKFTFTQRAALREVPALAAEGRLNACCKFSKPHSIQD